MRYTQDIPKLKLALRTSKAAAGVKREDSHQKVHAKTHGLGNMHVNMLGNMHVDMLGNMMGNMHVKIMGKKRLSKLR